MKSPFTTDMSNASIAHAESFAVAYSRLYTMLEALPPSRDRTLAITRLEDSHDRVVRALVAQDDATSSPSP
jgi:hypothetical protein